MGQGGVKPPPCTTRKETPFLWVSTLAGGSDNGGCSSPVRTLQPARPRRWRSAEARASKKERQLFGRPSGVHGCSPQSFSVHSPCNNAYRIGRKRLQAPSPEQIPVLDFAMEGNSLLDDGPATIFAHFTFPKAHLHFS